MITEQIQLVKGDITKIAVDAIVNAANSGLHGGGGVDGAIHRAGGPEIMEECRQIGGCLPGNAVITTAGNLPAKKVIHTVGPIWKGGVKDEEQVLNNAYVNSLKLAKENNLMVVSFPNISTGIYGFPKDLAAKIAIAAVQNFLKSETNMIVIFVCFDDENFNLYKKILEK